MKKIKRYFTRVSPTMSTATISQGWRNKGNSSFRNFCESNDNERKRNFLQSAQQSYYRSFETAETEDDRSSAAKNYGTASWRLASVLKLLGEGGNLVDFQLREAINYFSKAVVIGQRARDSAWCTSLHTSYGQCITEAIDSLRSFSYHDRVVGLERYVQAMSEDSQKAPCFLEMATVLSQAGVAALSNKEFIPALQSFHDCYRPIQECFRLSHGTGEVYSEANVIQADIGFHMATAEAIQAVKIGDEMLQRALEDDEILSMDLVYDAMDWYKKAVIATREVEVEMEAMAVSRLGSLFDKVLKIKSKAKDYFKLCIQLAASLQPRNFGTEGWYKTCVEAMQRYQAEAVNTEEAVREAERQNYLVELQSELKDLKDSDVGSGAEGLLRHVYKAYPPKNPDHKLDDSGLAERSKMKKVLLTAIQHYHPDKQDAEKHGRKWKVLCEEITKLLNRRYEGYKFLSESSV